LNEEYKRKSLELEAELESLQEDEEVHRSDEEWPMARATILVDENRKRKRPMEEMAPTSRYSFTFTPRKTFMSCRPEGEEYSINIRIITVWEI